MVAPAGAMVAVHLRVKLLILIAVAKSPAGVAGAVVSGKISFLS